MEMGDNMVKYCHKCGAELLDDADFCSKCGTQLSSVTEDKEKNKNIKTDNGKENADLNESLTKRSKIKNNKKLFAIIIAVIVVIVGAVILFSGVLSDHYTISEISTEKEMHVSNDGSMYYSYIITGFIDPVPTDTWHKSFKMDYYTADDFKVGTESGRLYESCGGDGNLYLYFTDTTGAEISYVNIQLLQGDKVFASKIVHF